MSSDRIIALVGTALILSACGPFQQYRLPVSAAEAPRTFSPIASVASGRGLRYAEHPKAVNVELDDATWVYFQIQNTQYNMTIVLDGEKVGEAQRSEKFAWAKQEADSIWDEAMSAYRNTLAPRDAGAAPVKPGVDVNIHFN